MSNEEAINDLSVLAERMDSKSNEIYVADISLESVETAIEALKEQDAGRWIPITERLPEEGERVLATHLGGLNPNRQVIEHIYENGKFTCGWDMDMDITSPTFGQRYMGDVTAWMPLPKPYKEGGRRNDERRSESRNQ